MEVLLYIAFAIFLSYTILMLYIIYGWNKIQLFTPDQHEQTPITLIIPARNEDQNIANCLHSILNQNYPTDKLQIIVVDDNSTDRTFELANEIATKSQFGISIIKLSDYKIESKKSAIQKAVAIAKNNLMVTTDADCVHHPDWLLSISDFYQKSKCKMIVAPVRLGCTNSFLEKFQVDEMLELSILTAGSIANQKPIMCNGANLAFEKTAFEEVHGYEGNYNIASGDDIFLMRKISKQFGNDSIQYLKAKEVIVKTKAVKYFSEFINQKIRWASKSFFSTSFWNGFVGGIIFLSNLLIPALVFCYFACSFISPMFLIICIASKFIIDFLLLHLAAKFFGKRVNPLLFLVEEIVYPIYLITIFILALTKRNYYWKGRKLK